MTTIPASENEFPQVLYVEGAAPSTPATGLIVAYAKAGGVYAWKDDGGVEHIVGEGDLTAHLADTSDAHDASAISVLDAAAVFTATEVESALKELYDAIAAGGAPSGGEYVTYAANGTLSAERVVEAPSSGGIIAKFIRKTSNEIVNNSATLQDDDALLFAIAASEVWEFQIDVWFMSGTTPDFKHAITTPAGATLRWTNTGVAASGSNYGDSNIVDTSGSALTHTGTGATTVNTSRVRGHVINGANAGNIVYQWAQNTQNNSDTTVLANSTIKAWRLA